LPFTPGPTNVLTALLVVNVWSMLPRAAPPVP
jgi:hypothetical protein